MSGPLPAGVALHELRPHDDERGRFTEIYRREWDTAIAPVQWNAVQSAARVLRGVHVHPVHADYLVLVTGAVTIGLRDLRDGAPEDGAGVTVDLAGDTPMALEIPPGVAHGFLHREPSLHIYAVSHYWDPADELGVRWDDPDLAIPWPEIEPLVSPRDEELPSLDVLRQQIADADRARMAADVRR